MQYIYLLGSFEQNDEAVRLSRAVRRYLDGREDVGGQPRVFVRGGRVNLEGVSPVLAKEIQAWCAGGERG